MEDQSLGLIEVLGLVSAIEAADAGSKAAKVVFHGYERGLAGLITVVFTGDVAAVRAAVAAGVAAAKRIGRVVAVDVIARPHDQLHVAADGAKPAEQTNSAAQQGATPAEPPEGISSKGTIQPKERAVPDASVVAVKASPQPSSTAVAVAEMEIAIASTVEKPGEGWTEAVPSGGNGDLPTAQVSTPVAVAAVEEAVPPMRQKERVRRTKLRKKP